MLKKIGLALTVASLGFTGAFADECDPCYCGGFTVGMSMAKLHSEAMTFVTVGYIDECFLLDIGANGQFFRHSSSSSSSSPSDFVDFGTTNRHRNNRNIGTFLGHFGLREQMYQDIYFTYGVQGSVSTKSWDDGQWQGTTFRRNDRVPYTVGVFAGLDIQLNDHYLLTGKIYPFSYQRNNGNNRDIKYAVFESGVLGIAYVF